MLLFREKIPSNWSAKVLDHLPEVLVDHAHLERKAATSAINLQKYAVLHDQVEALTAIAIEELQHFLLVLDLLRQRKIPFTAARPSAWISGLMRSVRQGQKHQAIDHLICAAFIEARSCEKFQILARALHRCDPPLAQFYSSLVESEGNHYASYLRLARHVDAEEAGHRLDFYLQREAELMRVPNSDPILH